MSGATFMGGPADGQLRDYPGSQPPQFVECLVPIHNPRFSDSINDDGTQTTPEPPYLGAKRFRYRREVSTLDDGPLWVFVPDTP